MALGNTINSGMGFTNNALVRSLIGSTFSKFDEAQKRRAEAESYILKPTPSFDAAALLSQALRFGREQSPDAIFGGYIDSRFADNPMMSRQLFQFFPEIHRRYTDLITRTGNYVPFEEYLRGNAERLDTSDEQGPSSMANPNYLPPLDFSSLIRQIRSLNPMSTPRRI